METVKPMAIDNLAGTSLQSDNTIVNSSGHAAGKVEQKQSEQGIKNLNLQTSIEGAQKAFNQINEMLKQAKSSIHFEVNREVDRVIIKVLDQETGKLIRQIPSEEALKISKNLTQYLEHIHASSQEYKNKKNLASNQSLGLIMDNQV